MKKIFLIIWGDAKFYQTLIFLSQKFSRQNLEVFILCRNINKNKDVVKNIYFGKNVRLLKSPIFFLSEFNLVNYIIFNFYILFQVLIKNPNHLIYFNKKALFNILITRFFKKKINYIYHNFDFEILNKKKKFIETFLIKLEFHCSKLCNHLVFPSVKRASIFKKFSMNKSSKYYSLMNCFPKKFTFKNSLNFNNFIKKKGLKSKIIVCHLGSIGPNHYIKEIIESFKLLNNKFILIIAGSSISGFAAKLRGLVKKNKLNNKVFIFENVSNNFWFTILNKSKLGLCFYNQNSLSHRHMAGTSQKFNNYLFSHTPMIVNNSPDFRKFKKKYDIFQLANPKNIEATSNQINNTLSYKPRYNKIKKNMKNAFSKELNFDYQYSISYDKIL
ncbi:glycosyltransferase [Candidatus Pelagibacter sp.]|nr:glycosyltransferase [Candidatus Pelagibacter sp.]